MSFALGFMLVTMGIVVAFVPPQGDQLTTLKVAIFIVGGAICWAIADLKGKRS